MASAKTVMAFLDRQVEKFKGHKAIVESMALESLFRIVLKNWSGEVRSYLVIPLTFNNYSVRGIVVTADELPSNERYSFKYDNVESCEPVAVKDIPLYADMEGSVVMEQLMKGQTLKDVIKSAKASYKTRRRWGRY